MSADILPMKKKIIEKAISVEEAQAVLSQEIDRRKQTCLKEMDAVLAKHGFNLTINWNYVLVPRG